MKINFIFHFIFFNSNDFYLNVVLAKTTKTHQTNSELYPDTEKVNKSKKSIKVK